MSWNESSEALMATLRAADRHRGFVVTLPDGRVAPSHPCLAPVAEAVASSPDYARHEACFFAIGTESEHLLAAFLHDTRRGQGAGGLRFWGYERVGDLVRDGLRLSRGMGHKSALAGLWWGGGKGIIARRADRDHTDPALRRAVYQDYGRFVTSLRGCYITAEDVGTTPADMAIVHETTRHATCVPSGVGGSGNPSRLTAKGVVVAMEAALDHAAIDGGLAGKTVAIQGLGNVATFVIEALLTRGVKRIVGTDIDKGRVAAVRDRFADAPLTLEVVARGDNGVLGTPCDVVAPCAVGATINPETIPSLRASIVCGAANNQLADAERDACALQARGIVYVPDFLANRMGIVNCANEQYGVFDGDPAIEAHLARDTPFGVYQRTREVLRRAGNAGTTSAAEAQRLADELLAEPHPIWPHRGWHIIQSLIDDGWEAQKDD